MEEKLAIWALTVTFISLLFLGMYCLFNVAMADVSTDYCYIHGVSATATKTDSFNLIGHRPWNNDIFIGNYGSLPAAVEAANAIGCHVR